MFQDKVMNRYYYCIFKYKENNGKEKYYNIYIYKMLRRVTGDKEMI